MLNLINKIASTKTSKQLILFGLVGITQNAIGYSIYILLTYMGGEPKLVMTIGYTIGVYISFKLNKSLTFSYSGNSNRAFKKFILSHILGYTINFLMLYVFVDLMNYNHMIIQAIAIFVVALMLFLLSKFFIFKSSYTLSKPK